MLPPARRWRAQSACWLECLSVPVIAVFGPTGVGKTALALALADRLRERGGTRWPYRPTRSRSTAAWSY